MKYLKIFLVCVLMLVCCACQAPELIKTSTPTPVPTSSPTIIPTPTSIPTPMPILESTNGSDDECGDGCTMGFESEGSSMRIKCNLCFEDDVLKYVGDFIYEDEPDRGYHNLRNPSYAELMDFLAADKTDEIPYSRPDFMCFHYSVTLRENANKQGFRCATVIEYYVPIEGDQYQHAHASNVFNTTDRGLIYIEPQNDQRQLVTNQWQRWPCTVTDSLDMTSDTCSRSQFLLYRLVIIW